MIFADRIDAANKIAERLKTIVGKKKDNTIIVGIPRGGAIIAYEIAKSLGTKFSLVVVKKIPSPFDKELGIGAITEDGTIYLNKDLINELNVSDIYIKEVIKRLKKEIEKIVSLYGLTKDRFKHFKDKDIVLVDDGIATGGTVIAAIKTIKKTKPNKVIIATPVVQKDVLDEIYSYVDHVISLNTVEILGAIGMFYLDFGQIEHEKVKEILNNSLFIR